MNHNTLTYKSLQPSACNSVANHTWNQPHQQHSCNRIVSESLASLQVDSTQCMQQCCQPPLESSKPPVSYCNHLKDSCQKGLLVCRSLQPCACNSAANHHWNQSDLQYHTAAVKTTPVKQLCRFAGRFNPVRATVLPTTGIIQTSSSSFVGTPYTSSSSR